MTMTYSKFLTSSALAAGLLGAAASVQAQTTFSFNDLKADASGTIGGISQTDPQVSISSSSDGDDLLYSFSYTGNDWDDIGGNNDSLTWTVRYETFRTTLITVPTPEGNDSSITIRPPSFSTRASAIFVNNFGADDGSHGNRDSARFTVEDVVLTVDDGSYGVTFNGFTNLWATAGNYIIGEGTNLPNIVTSSNGNIGFVKTDILTVTVNGGSERFRDLDGQFTVAPVPEPSAYALLGGLLSLGFVMVRRRR